MGTKGRGLNSEDLGLEPKTNGDLRLSNGDLKKKLGSRGGLQPPRSAPDLDYIYRSSSMRSHKK